jgi:hypothetical protein
MILAEVDHLAAGFMQNIPLLTPIFGRGFSFVFEQLPLPLRSILAAVYARLIGCQPLVPQPIDGSQVPAANHNPFTLFGHCGCNVDLSQINPNHFSVFKQGRDRDPGIDSDA